MVANGEGICPDCGGVLKHYDSVQRVVRTKRRGTKRVKIRRMRCPACGKLHRELPDDILPHKQYEAEIINGVLEGLITSDTLGYEDYPCEMTMIRWKSQKLQLLLWRNPQLKGD